MDKEPRERNIRDVSRKISPRLTEILHLAAQGKTDKEIASELGISIETIGTHWKRLRAYFESSSRTEIVANVLSSVYENRVDSLKEEQELLLFQIAERERAERKLKELNDNLEAEVARRTEWLANSLAQYQQQTKVLEERLEYLEKVNDGLNEAKVVVHRNEYGGLFRLLFFSESVKAAIGRSASDLVSGRVGPFHFMPPEDVTVGLRAMETFKDKPGGTHVDLVRMIDTDGVLQHVLEFIRVGPADESGCGTYLGVAVHLNDWLKDLKQMIKDGRFDSLDC